MKPYPPRATSVQVCRTILISLSFAVLLGGAQSALAQAPESSEDGFNAFQIILQRNIFDPDRKVQLPPSEQRPPPPRQPDPESFTLTGTMLYGDKKMAFFDGSSRDYQGVKDQKQTIADHMIDQVTADGVLLRRDGSDETIDMKVGMQLRRVGDAPWELSSALGGAPSSSRRRSRSACCRTTARRLASRRRRKARRWC